MRKDVFQAIADPTRRAIILLIAAQAMTPNDLASHFDISRQAVSKHIQVLKEAELVETEKQGREIYYELVRDNLKEVRAFMDHVKTIWETRFNQLDDLLQDLQS